MKLGFAVVFLLIFALPAVVAANDRIKFGPAGPPQTIAFHDAVASASVAFRVSHDARYDGCPGGVSPSISSGSLTVRAFGMSRRYDVAMILPIATNRILLSKESSCGTATALSRRGSYLVVEAILAEKGCAPLAAFINLYDGRVAKEAIFDPAWVHRFDVHPYHASGEPIRIVRVERIFPEASQVSAGGTSSTRATWPFLIVHATDERGATLTFAVDPGDQPAVDKRAVGLNAGDAAFKSSTDIGDHVLVKLFSGELFIRPGRVAEARSDAQQTPTPKDLQAGIRRNHWFEEANDRALSGDFVGAVDAFAMMVSLHGGGSEIDASDAAMLATCRDLEKRIRAGAVSASVASRAFSYGCVIQTHGTTHPLKKV